MQLHELKPIHKPKKSKRIGRGGKRGTYCGRGRDGQKSRAGRKMVPVIRQMIKKYHKLRGYRFKPKEQEFSIINIKVLEKNFKEREVVSPQVLFEKKLVRRIKGRISKIKILGMGELSKKLTVEKCQFSELARKKIEKAGGKIVGKKIPSAQQNKAVKQSK